MNLLLRRNTGGWLGIGTIVLALAILALPACSRKKVKRKRPKPPTIAQVAPASGPETGGTAITITGTRFAADVEVDVGGRPALAVMRLSKSSLTAITPPGPVGTADVRVSNAGDRTTATAAAAFTYVFDPGGFPTPSITAVTPNQGPVAGGTAISVTGTEFVAGALLFVGGRPATSVAVVSPTEITGETPAGAPGAASVSVINPDLQAAVLSAGFSYTFTSSPLSVASISPSSGPTDGGTVVTIAGDGFQPGITASPWLTNVGYVSDQELTAVTVPSPVGTVDLDLTNPGGPTVTLPGAFQFVIAPQPTVTGITPDFGEILGGTAVTVTGTNFIPGARALLDGVPIRNQSRVNDTTITGETPPRAQPGMVDVEVETANGTALLDDAFTYIPATGGAPYIIAITPTSGPIGTRVTIDGVNFAPTPAANIVRLDGELSPVETASTTQLSVFVPPKGRTGDFTVEVGGQLSNGVRFTVTSPVITAIVPDSGQALDPVTLIGENFSPVASENVVWFEGSLATVTSSTTTTIETSVPAEAAAGAVWVEVNGNKSNLVFFCVATPEPPWPQLRGMSPTSGPVGTTVTLDGEWFSLDPDNMYVWFNGIRTDVLTVDGAAYPPDVSITAQVPPGATTGDVWVTVNAQYTVIPMTFTVTTPPPPPPTITRISPESGEQDAGLLIEGSGFNAETHNNIVTINGAWADVVSASPTQLLVRVPFTSSGLVIVETGGQASLGVPFTVIPAPSSIQTVEYFGRDIPAPGDRVAYVLDTSDSMLVTFGDFVDRDGNLIVGGSEWELLLDRTIQSISELPTGFAFNIVSFSGFDDPGVGDCVPSIVPWQATSVPATQANKDAAAAWLQAIVPLGKTGTAAAVADALARDPLNRTLLLCTDGLWNCPTNQSGAEQLCTMFNANTQKAAIHSFGIKVQDRFARVLQDIAKITGGTFTLIE